jgi:hypothetical protein
MIQHFKKRMMTLFIWLLILPAFVSSGPVAYGLCQTACNAGAVTCYGLAGLVFGVAAVPGCSLAQGTCMAACTPLLIAPTP